MQLAPLDRTTHNLSVDAYKLVASIFVVFIHIPFPSPVGEVVSCIARTAVPSFFAFSGFFSYDTDCDRLCKRMKYLIKLMLWGFFLQIAANCFAIELRLPLMEKYQGSTVIYLKEILPDWNALAVWAILDGTPVNGALWYLTAALKCYGAFWCYVRFYGNQKPDYRTLYLTGFLLGIVYLTLGVMQTAAGSAANLTLIRNAVLLGIPMFAMGMFLRQYWERIWENFHLTAKKLLAAILFGIACSLFEQKTVAISDAHIGSFIIVLASLLLMARYPAPFRNPVLIAVAKRSSGWSVGVYLAHIPVNVLVRILISQAPSQWAAVLYWMRPACVALLSLAVAILNSAVYRRIKEYKNKRRPNQGPV